MSLILIQAVVQSVSSTLYWIGLYVGIRGSSAERSRQRRSRYLAADTMVGLRVVRRAGCNWRPGAQGPQPAGIAVSGDTIPVHRMGNRKPRVPAWLVVRRFAHPGDARIPYLSPGGCSAQSYSATLSPGNRGQISRFLQFSEVVMADSTGQAAPWETS
jgi:hypothetical protein